MPYKAVIRDSKLESYVASVDIYDEKGNFVEGTMVVEIIDKRTNVTEVGAKAVESTRVTKDTGVEV